MNEQVPKEEKLAPLRAALYRSIADLSAGGSVLCAVGAIEDFVRAVALDELAGALDRAKEKQS